jgi:hypothetical protein
LKSGILVNSVSPIAVTRMTEAHTPESLLPYLKPEMVSSAVAYLASEECRVTGHVISAGAGYFSRTQVLEGAGVCVDPAVAADPDTVASNFDRICDLSNAVFLSSAPEFIDRATRRFAKAR